MTLEELLREQARLLEAYGNPPTTRRGKALLAANDRRYAAAVATLMPWPIIEEVPNDA